MRRIATLPIGSHLLDTRVSVSALLVLVAILLVSLVGISALHDLETDRALIQADARRYSQEAALGMHAFLGLTHRMLSTLAISPSIKEQQPEPATAMLAELLKANPQYANIWVTRADGWNYASAVPPPGGTHCYIGDRSYFMNALRTGAVSVQSIPDNRQHPIGFAVVFSIPVPGPDGKANGTAQASFKLLPIEEMLSQIHLPPTAGVTVFDEAHYVVARYPSPEQWVGRMVDGSRVWPTLQDKHGGSFDGEFLDGERRLVGYAPIETAHWKVAVDFPPEAAYAGLVESVLGQMGLLVLPALIVAFLSWRLGRIAVDRANRYQRLLAAEQEARAQAEKAVRARDDFISIAAHELKTPVTALRGYAQLVVRQFEQTGNIHPDRVVKAMAQVDQQSARLSHLSEQLLNLSRLDVGRLVLHKEVTDLPTLATRAVASLRQIHPGRTLLFRNGTEASAYVDGPRLEQVLVSLVDNAARYSPRGTPIEIDLAAADPGWVEVAVRDHGDGVPEVERDCIFERFHQAHGGRHSGGIGIGLFVGRQIVEMHGGSIRCEQAAGGGSRFIIRLPTSTTGREAQSRGNN